MDDKLKATIDKIIKLANQNSEFKNELLKRLELSFSTNIVPHNDERISHIEKYLGLDYYVDTKNSVINYSHVSIDDVRNQLISDNREMMRFRYGTRYHEIDFEEFCIFAHLQAEMLINYYYDTVNMSDISAIKIHIKLYNPEAKDLDNATTLNSISFNTKLWAFNKEHRIDWELFDNLRQVRNDFIHRSPDKGKPEIEQYQHKLKSMGFVINSKGFPRINWKDPNADLELKDLYNKIKKRDEFKQYKHLLWYHSMPFDEIINGLKDLSKTISLAIPQ